MKTGNIESVCACEHVLLKTGTRQREKVCGMKTETGNRERKNISFGVKKVLPIEAIENLERKTQREREREVVKAGNLMGVDLIDETLNWVTVIYIQRERERGQALQ